MSLESPSISDRKQVPTLSVDKLIQLLRYGSSEKIILLIEGLEPPDTKPSCLLQLYNGNFQISVGEKLQSSHKTWQIIDIEHPSIPEPHITLRSISDGEIWFVRKGILEREIQQNGILHFDKNRVSS